MSIGALILALLALFTFAVSHPPHKHHHKHHHKGRHDKIVPSPFPGNLNVPVNTAPPSISGSAVQAQTLTEAHGTWTNTPTSYTYQWEDCDASGNGCVNIAAATSQTYVVQVSDVGDTIRVAETAINGSGSSSPAASNQTVVVTAPSAGPSCSPSPCNGVSTGFSSAPSYTVTANDGLNPCTSGCSNTVTTTFYEAVPSHLVLTDATHPVPLVFEFSSGSITAPTAQAWAQESGSSGTGSCTGTCAGPYAVVQMQGPYFTNGGTTCCQYGTPASVWSTAVGPQGSDPKGTNSCAGTPPAGFGSTAPCDIAPTILAILSAIECHTGTPPCLNVDTSKIYFTGGSKGGQATLDAMCDERTSSVGAAFGVDSDSLGGPAPLSGTASVSTAPNCAAVGQQCLYTPACSGSTNVHLRAIFMSGTFDIYQNSNGGGNISPNTAACNQANLISGQANSGSSAAIKTSATQNCASEGFLQNRNTWFWGHEQLAGCTLGEAGGSLLGGLGAGSPCATTTGTFNGSSATTIGGASTGLGGFLGCPQAPSTVTAFGTLTADPGGAPDPGWTNAANELIYRDHAPCGNGAELATVQVGDPSANLAGPGTYVGGNHLPQGVGGWDSPVEFMKFFTKQAMP